MDSGNAKNLYIMVKSIVPEIQYWLESAVYTFIHIAARFERVVRWMGKSVE